MRCGYSLYDHKCDYVRLTQSTARPISYRCVLVVTLNGITPASSDPDGFVSVDIIARVSPTVYIATGHLSGGIKARAVTDDHLSGSLHLATESRRGVNYRTARITSMKTHFYLIRALCSALERPARRSPMSPA